MWANGGVMPLISLRRRLQAVSVTCQPLYSKGKAEVRLEYLLLLPRLEPRYLSRPSRALVTIRTVLVMAFYLIADQEVDDVTAR